MRHKLKHSLYLSRIEALTNIENKLQLFNTETTNIRIKIAEKLKESKDITKEEQLLFTELIKAEDLKYLNCLDRLSFFILNSDKKFKKAMKSEYQQYIKDTFDKRYKSLNELKSIL